MEQTKFDAMMNVIVTIAGWTAVIVVFCIKY